MSGYFLPSEAIPAPGAVSPSHTLTSNYLLHHPLSRRAREQEIERRLGENGRAILGRCRTHKKEKKQQQQHFLFLMPELEDRLEV